MKRFVLFLLPALLMTFTGCSDPSSSASSAENQNIDPQSTADEQPSQTNKDDVKRDSTSVENPTHHPSTNTDNHTDDQNAKTDSGSKTTDTSNIHLSSETAAIEYLRRQLEMDNNDDIAFNNIGGALKTDKTGSYYTIKLISKSIRENGGSGTVGIYKVYQDGTYTTSKN
ncbi:hypothetical protein [Tuberibacillus sp. Marseille-P3662]|uniref:hypothetical protein n=1 Tax=Tuberibacillus sp. Marseille-P3662 TaxID=1965358 RepID=UPI000A1CB63A|nr:hypothetical protein [Tuberibacillus sp. Marseille-P3662]